MYHKNNTPMSWSVANHHIREGADRSVDWTITRTPLGYVTPYWGVIHGTPTALALDKRYNSCVDGDDFWSMTWHMARSHPVWPKVPTDKSKRFSLKLATQESLHGTDTDIALTTNLAYLRTPRVDPLSNTVTCEVAGSIRSLPYGVWRTLCPANVPVTFGYDPNIARWYLFQHSPLVSRNDGEDFLVFGSYEKL